MKYVIEIITQSTKTGKLEHELRTFARAADGRVEGLLWSPDAQYLVAAVPSFFGIGIFNVKTGRYCGDFSTGANCNGLALLSDTGQLVAGCEDGRLRFWDFVAALQQIRRLEASLLAPLADLEQRGGDSQK